MSYWSLILIQVIVLLLIVAIASRVLSYMERNRHERQQSAKRQAELSAFWRAEMQRLNQTPANPRATITNTPPPFERIDTKSEYYR